MAFDFSLAAVLRYRESIERRELLALERITSEITTLQLQLVQVEQLRQVEAECQAQEFTRGAPAFHLQCGYGRDFELELQKAALKQKVQDLEVQRKQQLKVYDDARQGHELLDGMRDRQFECYQRDDDRRQQKAQDDLSLSRRKKK